MTDTQGEDEVFRAHEVAHQWWGISVDFLTYHDQWLSEGFSDFSGLWYMQTIRKDNNKYFGVLKRWRSSIFERGSDPGPIWMGYRTNTVNDQGDYGIVVYKKGAWVLHMLRALMIDLKTMNEDRFTATMKDFYTTYRGKRASTEDFRSVVENHVGADMGWFFDQWVYGASLPTYKVATIIAPIEAGKYRVRLQVTQEGVPDSFLAYVPVAIELDKGVTVRVRIKVTGHQSEIELPPLPSRPKNVKFNDLEGVLADVKTVDWRYQ
jgi:aminopeptidase N